MAMATLYTCDGCGAEERSEDTNENGPRPLSPRWARLNVHTQDEVLPRELDEVAAAMHGAVGPGVQELLVAQVETQRRGVSLWIDLCPVCRAAHFPLLDRFVADYIAEREQEERDAMPPYLRGIPRASAELRGPPRPSPLRPVDGELDEGDAE